MALCMQAQLRAVELQSWLHDAAQLFARQIVLTNVSNCLVTLVHVTVLPNARRHYMVLDEGGLAARSLASLAKAGEAGDVPDCIHMLPGTSTGECCRRAVLDTCSKRISRRHRTLWV